MNEMEEEEETEFQRAKRRQKLDIPGIFASLNDLYSSLQIPGPFEPFPALIDHSEPNFKGNTNLTGLDFESYRQLLHRAQIVPQENTRVNFSGILVDSSIKCRRYQSFSGIPRKPETPDILKRLQSKDQKRISDIRNYHVRMNSFADQEFEKAIEDMEGMKIGQCARPSFKTVVKSKVPKELEEMELKKREKISKQVYDNIVAKIIEDTVRIKAKKSIPLTQEHLDLYDMVMSRRLPGGHVLIHKFGVEITAQLASCLKNGTWLNDEVINFYFDLLSERSQRKTQLDSLHPKSAFLNSFFYTKLSENGYNYSGVKRWTKRRKIDIFGCDLVFFPVNQSNLHWTLGVINVAEKRIEFFDSMGGRGGSYFNIMEKYLVDEYRDKKNDELEISEWSRLCPEDIPHQANGFDCGMFVCKFADFRSDDLPMAFSQKDLTYFRKRLFTEICSGFVI